ncbi:hypothetical protein DFH94DRAFT_429284 [Russula ochroleuca]|jgi:hypothetical protein|uniref:Uncharacterized protein n=1 Tax=Russula ochroleuca TaxID=152965 RepID=A0A9P5MWU1_9AGAM|nr:hypothetical protein DFH94DRAFT_429284 [Russula ochroleuca]
MQSFSLVMRLIALVSVALAVSASVLPSQRDIENNAIGLKKRDGSDPQTSLTLDQSVICTNFEQDGSANATAGQSPSQTSGNNYINFCKTVNLPLTNGLQIQNGSCNPAPMGVIAPSTNMPSSKFVTPKNLDAVQANTTFEIVMAIKNLQTGNFTNPDSTYYAAPQLLNSENVIIGHTHFVIEQLSSITSTQPSDPTKFAHFVGVNTPADDQGNVSVNVTGGLPPGVYKLSSINTSANHVPVLVAVAQHGSMDDQIYFFVTADGKRPDNID